MADIFGVRVTPGLDTLGTFVICNNPGGQIDPSVTFNGENFLVVWSDPFYDRNPGIVAALVTPQGVVVDSGIHVGDGHDYPDVVFDGNRSLVIWHEDFLGVLGRFINNLGQPEDSSFIISRITGSSTMPKMAFGNGVFLVVYADFCSTGTDLDIYGQLVSSQGQIVGSEITIADGPAGQSFPDVDFDGFNFFVVWQQNNHAVFGRSVSTDGFLLGNELQISQDTLYNREYPAIAGGFENYLIVWSEFHDDFDVFGNIDIAIGVEEELTQQLSRNYPSIISGPLVIDGLQNVIIYDVAGRRISPDNLKPGVYFLVIDHQRVEKVVKVR
ncbi:MAG: hypothetical protein WBB37_11175 [bacterium]